MRLVLGLALTLAPASLLVVAASLPTEPGPRWLQLGALASAGAWLAVVVDADPGLELGTFRPGPFAAAAACGAALVVVAARPTAPRPSIYASGVALGALVAALGAADSALPLAAGLSAAAAAAALSARLEGDGPGVAVVGVAGAALVVLGLVLLHGRTDTWDLPPPAPAPPAPAAEVAPDVGLGVGIPLAAGAGLLAGAGAFLSRRTGALLLPGGLAVGALALPLAVDGTQGAPLLSVPLAAMALVTAVSGSRRWLPGQLVVLHGRAGCVSLALGLWSLAATAAPGDAMPAALLLGAAAVVTSVLPTPLASIAAIPGAVALGHALVGAGGVHAGLLGVLLLLTAVTLAHVAFEQAEPFAWRDDITAWPALGLAGWLAVAPGTWAWVGDADLEPYDEGAALAVAAGLAVLVLSRIGRRHLEPAS